VVCIPGVVGIPQTEKPWSVVLRHKCHYEIKLPKQSIQVFMFW